MAQKILVEFPTETIRDIPNDFVQAGRRLLSLLQEESLDITAAFWQFLGPDEQWQLILATPVVQKEGPLKVIQALQRVIGENQNELGVGLSNILVQSPVSTLVQAAKRKYGNLPSNRGWGRTSLSDDEAYVYILR